MWENNMPDTEKFLTDRYGLLSGCNTVELLFL